MGGLIARLIDLGIRLLICGTLGNFTMALMGKAAQDQLISLVKLNRQLTSGR